MKKFIFVITLLSLPLFASAQTFERDMYFGIQGDSGVQQLQEFLADQGYYSGPITGNFFSLTFSAVKKFQTAQGIVPASGYAGPKTRAKIDELLAQEGVSSSSVTNESGVTVSVSSTSASDSMSQLVAQLQLLQQQLSALQQQSIPTVQQQISQPSITPTASVSTPVTATVNNATLDFDQTSPFTVAREATESKISWHSQNLTNCLASGNWSGTKVTNGSEKLGVTYMKDGSYTYTLLCGTLNGSTISKTLTVNVISGTPAITLQIGSNTASRQTISPNSAVQFSWSTTVPTGESMQCTANDAPVSTSGMKEVVVTEGYFVFKVKCVTSNGVSAEKSIQTIFPGYLTISADGSVPVSQTVSGDGQPVYLNRFKLVAFYDKFNVQELRFQISPNASSVVTNASGNIITVGNYPVLEDSYQTITFPLSIGKLNDIPSSGLTIRVTNVYARYTKSDGTVITTTTPGDKNTQPYIDVVLTPQ